MKIPIDKIGSSLVSLYESSGVGGLTGLTGSIFIDNDIQYHYSIQSWALYACVTRNMTIEYFEALYFPNSRDNGFVVKDFRITSPHEPESDAFNKIPFSGSDKHKGFLLNVIAPLLSILYFAEIETKVIQSSNKKNTSSRHNGVKNSTSIPIEVIDSTWFTTIVRTEGFAVNGHFRFQPCGQSREQRKLIWIDGFEKKGYTRIARKEL